MPPESPALQGSTLPKELSGHLINSYSEHLDMCKRQYKVIFPIFITMCRTDGSEVEYCFVTGGSDPQLVTNCIVGDGTTTETREDTTVDTGETTTDLEESTVVPVETTTDPESASSTEKTTMNSGSTAKTRKKQSYLHSK